MNSNSNNLNLSTSPTKDSRKPPTPHLGASLLIAIADGHTVQTFSVNRVTPKWEAISPQLALKVMSLNNPEDWDDILRVEPRIVIVSGVEVPEPISRVPELDDIVWAVDFSKSDGTNTFHWNNSKIQHRFLERGLCHLTHKDALSHSAALLSPTEHLWAGGEGADLTHTEAKGLDLGDEVTDTLQSLAATTTVRQQDQDQDDVDLNTSDWGTV